MKSNYQKWIHKFGISTSLLLLAAMIGLPVAASLIYGIWPDFGELWPGFVAVVLFMAPYLPSETIGYMSVMGPGAYTFLTLPAMSPTLECLLRLAQSMHWESNRIRMSVIRWQLLPAALL